ncbi:hypothetical protein [Cryobacterium fucosi]|uniref:Uncharacterized protein n=1 Tax=Cryobacterium fucosi TaxID=1259157 RepID=A0A4R9B2S3_9MICO|nr:hypothetical protein [Cryobacterium fucosi]TFD74735.1 hypothetical protein E3T48_12480 [Cryobacterium fucosi]
MVEVVIDRAEWYRLAGDLKAYEPALLRALRRRLKKSGDLAALAVKAKLASAGGGDVGHENRAALIAGTRVSVSFAERTAGVKIVTNPSKLPATSRGLAKAFNLAEFRHRVYGRKVWVPQKGRPYFNTSIDEVARTVMVREMQEAMDEATAVITSRVGAWPY